MQQTAIHRTFINVAVDFYKGTSFMGDVVIKVTFPDGSKSEMSEKVFHETFRVAKEK